mmetsp:Transcript_73607/g.146391  ORF Transcript_73607/g.146391 Transcript_73607/m.146391 type:complete len:216 (-) Transcript_73607:418-1065(-)
MIAQTKRSMELSHMAKMTSKNVTQPMKLSFLRQDKKVCGRGAKHEKNNSITRTALQQTSDSAFAAQDSATAQPTVTDDGTSSFCKGHSTGEALASAQEANAGGKSTSQEMVIVQDVDDSFKETDVSAVTTIQEMALMLIQYAVATIRSTASATIGLRAVMSVQKIIRYLQGLISIVAGTAQKAGEWLKEVGHHASCAWQRLPVSTGFHDLELSFA